MKISQAASQKTLMKVDGAFAVNHDKENAVEAETATRWTTCTASKYKSCLQTNDRYREHSNGGTGSDFGTNQHQQLQQHPLKRAMR